MAVKKYVREASDPTIVCHNPPPTEEMEEFAVKQEFKKDCDINEIIGRMNRGIQPPPWMTSKTPYYGDFSNLPCSFQEAYQIMADGQEAFMSLPLEMRQALDHDPRNLDRADRAMYEKFGLLKRPEGADGIPSETEERNQRSGEQALQKKPASPAGGKKGANAPQNDSSESD